MSDATVVSFSSRHRDASPIYPLFCPPLATSPRIAREFVASVLRWLGLHAITDTVALCTSELVTNSVLHASGSGALLSLAVERGQVLVTVRDDGAALPRPRRAGENAESGRGLEIVEALADRWGATATTAPARGSVRPPGGDGKAVWFAVALPVARG